MKRRLATCTLAVALWFSLAVSARTELLYSESGLTVAIPDNSPQGILRTATLSGLDASLNYSVRLSLRIGGTGFGGYLGDLYGYLSHGVPGGEYRLSVLLNRPGRTGSEPSGYDESGLDVVFSDGATQDIHLYRNFSPTILSGVLQGEWQPDGRLTSPYEVDASDPRTAGLDSLGAINPNGTWNLFLADLEAGGTMQLEAWGLELTPLPVTSAVPEPSQMLSGLLLLGIAAAVVGKRFGRRVRRDGSRLRRGHTISH
jgi:subtilisin-like proprotein convertase family protein